MLDGETVVYRAKVDPSYGALRLTSLKMAAASSGRPAWSRVQPAS